MPRAAPHTRAYDVILYGATGFVGRQTVQHFAHHAGGLRWALAGRSAQRLEAVRAQAGPGAAGAGIVVADAGDAAALDALAAQARVVLSTAGPFAVHGSALVAACVARRTHYVDITGETPWVRTLIDRHHEQARREGTRIIPCCGFDSVPSDLGAFLVARHAWRSLGERCVQVKACHTVRGGLNGGTLASALNMLESGQSRAMADPYLLNPANARPAASPLDTDPFAPHRDADFDAWVGPFVMGPVNTRIVRRSSALFAADQDPAWLAPLHYQEYLRVGRGAGAALSAAVLSAGMGAGAAAMRLGPARSLVRAMSPRPGQGPSERTMDGGFFRCELVGTTASGHTVRGRIAGRGDPGNRATTTLVCESALALAVDGAGLPGGPARGGVLTPAYALGEVLARRLAARGMTVEPLEHGSAAPRTPS